jgi:hypothetical protein
MPAIPKVDRLNRVAVLVGIIGTLAGVGTPVWITRQNAASAASTEQLRRCLELRRLREHVRTLELLTVSEHPDRTSEIVWDEPPPACI